MTFDNVAFVWCGNSWKDIKARPSGKPVCSVAAWPMALGCNVLGWDGNVPGSVPVDELRKYDVFLVNLFSDSRHVEQIKAAHPGAFVVAMPDPYLELVLYGDNQRIMRQMAMADVIGGRTQHDAAVYGALLDKPAFWLPSPVGPADIFRALWDDPKEDVIITTEHNGIPNSSVATIAALVQIQRYMPDVPIHFYKPSDKTRAIAEISGLRVVWKQSVPYAEMARQTARARWGVDLYAGHSQGRNLMTHAMTGTPVVGSCTNNPAGTFAVDPYHAGEAAQAVMQNWQGTRYEAARQRAFEFTEAHYGFDASRQRMAQFIGSLESLETMV